MPSRATIGNVVGPAGIVTVAAGAWGLWGWPAACFVLGLPVAVFYLLGEGIAMLRGGRHVG